MHMHAQGHDRVGGRGGCMHVCLHVRMHVHTCVCARVCMCIHACACRAMIASGAVVDEDRVFVEVLDITADLGILPRCDLTRLIYMLMT